MPELTYPNSVYPDVSLGAVCNASKALLSKRVYSLVELVAIMSLFIVDVNVDTLSYILLYTFTSTKSNDNLPPNNLYNNVKKALVERHSG
ncbi:hypothetical protein FF38_01090 [Lucilia cuprina]|uniref:Uncharacterized protein n=1 Tax=Lucilia cuprina TaxID=7375 RepID=A0A0L0C4P9_LUCCU|nr:hypothetical protein FF38_01090 [Lucilia cuprina]